MFQVINICVGEKIYEPGKHFVLSTSGISPLLEFGSELQREICPPDGYTVVSYSEHQQALYVNKVRVKAKVYEKKGQRFCPDFGVPVTTTSRRR